MFYGDAYKKSAVITIDNTTKEVTIETTNHGKITMNQAVKEVCR